MTDLTLNEYSGVPEDELKQILREEARNICGPYSCERNIEEIDTDLGFFSLALQYWTRVTGFISTMLSL